MHRKKITLKSWQVEVSIEDIDVNSPDETYEPYAVLRAKTLHLAELLGCDEMEAERILFDRLGAS